MTWKKITQYGYYDYGDYDYYDSDNQLTAKEYKKKYREHRDWIPVTPGDWVHKSGKWLISKTEYDFTPEDYSIAPIPSKMQGELVTQINSMDDPRHIRIENDSRWMDGVKELQFPGRSYTFEKARLKTLLPNRKKMIQKAHEQRKHSAFCSPGLCVQMNKSHKSDHKKCNIYSCDSVRDLHFNGDHNSCSSYFCEPTADINKSHRQGAHSKYYCDAQNCKEVAKSHMMDHALCDTNTCSTISKLHYKDNHTLCHSCYNKEKIKKYHKDGMHSPRECDPINCPDIARSHFIEDHELCNSTTSVSRDWDLKWRQPCTVKGSPEWNHRRTPQIHGNGNGCRPDICSLAFDLQAKHDNNNHEDCTPGGGNSFNSCLVRDSAEWRHSQTPQIHDWRCSPWNCDWASDLQAKHDNKNHEGCTLGGGDSFNSCLIKNLTEQWMKLIDISES